MTPLHRAILIGLIAVAPLWLCVAAVALMCV
jgi:hypothetical protein